MKPHAQIAGNAGLYFYYTCFRLSMLGCNVMPTARNACGFDVFAYSDDGKRYLTSYAPIAARRTGECRFGSSLGSTRPGVL